VRQKPVLITEPDARDLEKICDVLNSKSPNGTELRLLITIWQRSGPNLQKMLWADHVLWRELQATLDTLYLPTRTGRAHLALLPTGDPHDAKNVARVMFARFTLNPETDKLGGPCPRCEKYFIRKTAKQSVYCSHRCASQATAIKRTIEIRQEQHDKKLEIAREGIIEWEKLRRKRRVKEGWKEWVAAYNPAAEITTRFLTRAVNQGTLQAPSIDERRTNGRTK
jgi:hypothetical protein